MEFVSTRDTSYSTTSEEALIYSTKISNSSLFFCKRIDYNFINENFLNLNTESIFIKVFYYFLGDLFSEKDIQDIFIKVKKKFKNENFFEIYKLLNFEICSITNGQSSCFRDFIFSISSEIFQKYIEKTNNKLNILHIGNSIELDSFVKAFSDKDDIKSLFLYNQIDNKFGEFNIKNHNNKNISIAKIDVDNLNYASFKNDVYFHRFMNFEYKISVVDDINFLNIISYVFLYSILFKHYKRSFIISSVDSDYTMSTASYLSKELGLNSLKQFINTTYGTDILFNVLNNNTISKKIKKEERDDNLSILTKNSSIENLERILYHAYSFDSISINRIISIINKDDSYTLNSNIVKKLNSFIFNYNLIDSSEIYNQISSTVKNENLYIDQYTCAGILGTNNFTTVRETKDLIINFELYKYDMFLDFISKVVGFEIKNDKPWNGKIKDQNIDTFPSDLESINKLAKDAFN